MLQSLASTASRRVLGVGSLSRSWSSHHLRSLTTTTRKPFEKVLIANRGEIVQRVMQTCQALDIQTVAIYSTADAKAPFVEQADEAICMGPAPANQSYLNTNAVLQAIQDSGAQAVHPGYGFLSENAAFSQSIQDVGAVWLGPPAHAVHQMGDKLLSKKLADEAGVNCIPGHDAQVESIEEALMLCNEKIGYPVLLKAAAGGGGKGMRVCYNDQEIKDAWGVAKAEAKNFFSDDRLLLEKFIEKPHHIEFQVLCAKVGEDDFDVVVFPERECSIQRRNQKVIEESPSALLTEETRQQMAEQVVRLCKTTKYESAGTVEFLVDENQNFFFLEMNTRLQVEHPVSESIAGVDLVKGMLWVGAGWGLPEEYDARQGNILMPHKGHAVEARIYAEDPLRGFLPSTGPLLPYAEPSLEHNTPDKFIRMDSGVAEGHIVTTFYDPMLSKAISYAPNRREAIQGLCQALDEYVIEGVQHNARLVQSVLRHPEFLKGNTPTSFLPTHYPDGFKGVELTDPEQEEFAVAAAAIGAARRTLLQQPPLGAAGPDDTVVVRLRGLFGTAFKVQLGDKKATVCNMAPGGEERTIQLGGLKYDKEYVADVNLDGKHRSIQVLKEDVTGEIKMQMFGADMKVLIQSPREYELSTHMHVPLEVDTSSMVLSPMPGTLISYAVNEGDEVQDGQELCVVEAMKMQNLIRSPRHGVISKLNVKVGSSLRADEVIMEFEEEASEAA